jgi:hypothetical protein
MMPIEDNGDFINKPSKEAQEEPSIDGAGGREEDTSL